MEGSRGLEALGSRHEERAVQRRRAHHHAHSKLRGRSATLSVLGKLLISSFLQVVAESTQNLSTWKNSNKGVVATFLERCMNFYSLGGRGQPLSLFLMHALGDLRMPTLPG